MEESIVEKFKKVENESAKKADKQKKKKDAKSQSIFYDEYDSWLLFNDRVINEGTRSKYPILERLNFIGIADSNLDEFIRTKYGVKGGSSYKKKINAQTKKIEDEYEKLLDELRTVHRINITTMSCLIDNQEAYASVRKEFKKNIYPMIQPLVLTLFIYQKQD